MEYEPISPNTQCREADECMFDQECDFYTNCMRIADSDEEE